jgi:hypothetical protein
MNKKIPKPKKNKTGMAYGHWIVKEQDLIKSEETGKVYWKCECDCGCGTTKSLRTDALYQVTVGGCDNMLGTQEKECQKCHKKFFTKKQAKTRKYCYDCIPEENYTGAEIRKRIKIWALDYKGKQCECCGYNKCTEALEFHHINPNEKDFNISDRDIKLDWKEIQKELDKCILVCSNCHREIHAGIRELKGGEV